jgi:hypothetical protein
MIGAPGSSRDPERKAKYTTNEDYRWAMPTHKTRKEKEMDIKKIVTKRGTEYEVGKGDVREIYLVEKGEAAGQYNVLIGDAAAALVSDVVEVHRAE